MAAAYEPVCGINYIATESTLINWANVLLKPTGKDAITFKSFSNGILFIHLLRLVCDIRIEPKKDKPTSKRDKREIIKSFLTEMRSNGLLKENVDETLVLDGDFETMKKLLVTLLLYRIQDGLRFFAFIGISPRHRFLKWIGNQLKNELVIRDFGGEWKNGIALGALVESFLPGSCSGWKTWSPINAERNAAQAMFEAAEWLDVHQIMTPKDMTSHTTDEESRMAYLSQFLFARVKPGFECVPMTQQNATDERPIYVIPRTYQPLLRPHSRDSSYMASGSTQEVEKPIIPPKPTSISDIYDWSSDIWSQVDQRFKKELDNVVIPKDSIEIGRKIGKGEYGEVFEARMKDKLKGYQMVAVKKLTGVHDAKKASVVNFLKEAALLQNMKHENIVPLKGFLIINSQPHIVQHLMESSLLDHLRKEKGKLDENDLYGYLSDAAKGLAYVAHNKIVHRDIAARNCLLTEHLLVKIGDFGMARDIFQTGYYSMSDPENTRMAFRWMASEAVNRNKFTLASDVFSFGVLMYEVLTKGETPYGEMPVFTLIPLINGDKRPPLKISTDYYPVEIQQLFYQCLSEVPSDRPTMKAVSSILEKYPAYSKFKEDPYDYMKPTNQGRPLPKRPDE